MCLKGIEPLNSAYYGNRGSESLSYIDFTFLLLCFNQTGEEISLRSPMVMVASNSNIGWKPYSLINFQNFSFIC